MQGSPPYSFLQPQFTCMIFMYLRLCFAITFFYFSYFQPEGSLCLLLFQRAYLCMNILFHFSTWSYLNGSLGGSTWGFFLDFHRFTVAYISFRLENHFHQQQSCLSYFSKAVITVIEYSLIPFWDTGPSLFQLVVTWSHKHLFFFGCCRSELRYFQHFIISFQNSIFLVFFRQEASQNL